MNNKLLNILLFILLVLGICPVFSQSAQTNSMTITVTLKEIGTHVLVTSPDNQTGNPGETLTYQFTVKNIGDSRDIYNLETISSNQWNTGFHQRSRIGPLRPGKQQVVKAWVEIPQNASINTEDQLTLTAISIADPSVSDSDSVTTTVKQNAGVEIETSPKIIRGRPGQILSLRTIIINTGDGDDSFVLTASSSLGWEIQFPAGDTVGPIEPKKKINTLINVIIPADAQKGARDTVTITATSQLDPSVSQSSSSTAIVR